VRLVIVRPAFYLTRLHRQERLRAIEGRNLRLFVDAAPRHAPADSDTAPDVADLFDQQRIVRQLKRLAPMRLQPNVCQIRLMAM
jgi:hypothetical protein